MGTILFYTTPTYMLCRVFLYSVFDVMCKLCHLISYKKGKNKAKINIKTTANISTSLELQYITVCVSVNVITKSSGWGLLMQVNIAFRAAILIMGNIIQYIVDDYEPLARPTKLQAHSVQDAFSFTRSLQTTLHYWHRWQNVDAYFYFIPFKGGMGGRGK